MTTRADGIVLVHGAKHDSRCWQPTVDALRQRDPALSVHAVDLPGRQGMPGEMTLAGCVESVVDQINHASLDTMLLVGHSLAGVTVPGIATALGADRVRRIVAVSCCVPPEGQTTADSVGLPSRLVARLLDYVDMPRWLARQLFCTGMSKEQAELCLSWVVPDAPDTPGLTRAPADRSALPARIPRTWVLTLRDRAITPRVQLRFAANLGASEIVPLDTGHNAMISEPDALAAILLERL